MNLGLRSYLEESPVSTRTFLPFGVLIIRLPRVSVTRLLSSASSCRHQSVFGTVPNIAPPSRRNRPSDRGNTSKRPIFIQALLAQHFLYFLPEPHVQGSLRPIAGPV